MPIKLNNKVLNKLKYTFLIFSFFLSVISKIKEYKEEKSIRFFIFNYALTLRAFWKALA